ncbi:MAG: hypothetical protein ACRDLD_12140 [Thermoleophilaceae bacterium]
MPERVEAARVPPMSATTSNPVAPTAKQASIASSFDSYSVRQLPGTFEAVADRDDLEFTYSLIDRVFRLSLGEPADFSGAKYTATSR